MWRVYFFDHHVSLMGKFLGIIKALLLCFCDSISRAWSSCKAYPIFISPVTLLFLFYVYFISGTITPYPVWIPCRVLDISVARQVYNYHLRRPLIPACALRYTIIACSTAAFLTIRLKYRTYTLNRIRRLSYTHVYLNLHLKTTWNLSNFFQSLVTR